MNTRENECSSDDEVYVGKLTLEEIRKRFKIKSCQKTFPSTTTKNSAESSELVKCNSEPDIPLISSKDEPTTNHPIYINEKEDDSFLKLEKLVSEMDVSQKSFGIQDQEGSISLTSGTNAINVNINLNIKLAQEDNENNVNQNYLVIASPASQYCTPMKDFSPCKNTKTPLAITHLKSPSLRTPVYPNTFKKPSSISVKKTPSKNLYQHIESPIAAYIKNSTQVNSNEIKTKKAAASFIPKPLKSKHQIGNKENIILPNLAYKCAKSAKVIDDAERDKLPKSNKKDTSTVPKPLVLKLVTKKVNPAEK